MLEFVLLGFLAFVFYWNVKMRYVYWLKREVPFDEPTFFIGNMGKVLRQKLSLGGVYEEYYNKYKDKKYVGFFKCLEPCIIVRDLDLARKVMIENFSSFHDNEMMVKKEADPLFGRNPFVLRGNDWKVTRGHLTPSFTTAKTKIIYPLIEANCKTMDTYLKDNVANTKEVEARDFCRKYTLDNVATCVFGIEGDAFTNPDSKMFKVARTLIKQSFIQGLKEFCVLAMPKLGTTLKIKFFPKNVTEFIIKLVNDTLSYRRDNKIIRNDFLQMMLEKRDKSEFTDLDLAAHCAGFFIDGVETSSTVMSYALFELAANPHVQTKLREEVAQARADNGGKLPYDVMLSLPYLECVLNECVRKNPALPFYSRICQQTHVFPPADNTSTKDVTIEVGTPVIVPIYAIHRDATYFPDPEKFDPDRFLPENVDSIPKYAYMPFGEGPRLCLGKRFGVVQVKMGLIAAITNFELRVHPRTQTPLTVDPRTFMIAPIGGIWLDFHRISKQ